MNRSASEASGGRAGGRTGFPSSALTFSPVLALILTLALLPVVADQGPVPDRARLRAGVALAERGDHEGAVRELRAYTSEAPSDPDGHFYLGRALLALALQKKVEIKGAVSAFEEALRLDPSRDHVRYQLAEVYARRTLGSWNPEEAIRLFDDLGRRLRSRPQIALRFAQWLLYTEVRVGAVGDGTRVYQDSDTGILLAAEHLDRILSGALPGSPLSIEARTLRAEVFFRYGDYQKALEHLNMVIREAESGMTRAGSDFNLAPAWNSIGHALFRMGKHQAAVEAFTRAQTMAPSLSYQWDLWLAYQELGGYPKSVPVADRFIFREERYDRSSPPRLKFRDIAPDLGIDRSAGVGPCGWADYDGDGQWDLVLCGADRFCKLFKGDGRSFVDVTDASKLSGLDPGFGSAWGDYDNDGDPDLHISRNGWNGAAPNSLLRNNGDGTFSDRSGPSGLADAGSSFHSAWFDYDRDGWLDLVVSNGVYLDGSTNKLYRNQRDGTFADMTLRAGLTGEVPGFGTIGVALGDYDDDGWPDIFFHGRFAPNRLYRNNHDGTFTDTASRAGVAGQGDQNGYVALMADFDSDGDLDIWTGSMATWDDTLAGYRADYPVSGHKDLPRLYSNNGDGTFRDVSMEVGFRYPLGIMAVGTADLDNDGYLDIYMGTGSPELRRTEPNIFYHNRGGRFFEDLTRFTGFGTDGKGHGVTFIDWDEDGDLDLYTELGGFFRGDWFPNHFYLNLEGNRNHWLQFRLLQEMMNRQAIGARVTVEAGELSQVQEVTAGRGFGSTDPPVLHFGLGSESRARRVTIRWPDGKTEVMEDLAVDRRLVIRREDQGGSDGPAAAR